MARVLFSAAIIYAFGFGAKEKSFQGALVSNNFYSFFMLFQQNIWMLKEPITKFQNEHLNLRFLFRKWPTFLSVHHEWNATRNLNYENDCNAIIGKCIMLTPLALPTLRNYIIYALSNKTWSEMHSANIFCSSVSCDVQLGSTIYYYASR